MVCTQRARMGMATQTSAHACTQRYSAMPEASAAPRQWPCFLCHGLPLDAQGAAASGAGAGAGANNEHARSAADQVQRSGESGNPGPHKVQRRVEAAAAVRSCQPEEARSLSAILGPFND